MKRIEKLIFAWGFLLSGLQISQFGDSLFVDIPVGICFSLGLLFIVVWYLSLWNDTDTKR